MSRWDPWAELAAVQRDVQELFGRTGQGRTRGSSLVPPMDAYRTEKGIVLKLELPGTTPDQVEVSYAKGVLTISGQRGMEDEVAQDNWLRRERPVGSFTRSITLAEGVDPSGIAANFEHGVLEVFIPNAPEEQAHRIPIQGKQPEPQTVDVEGSSQQSG